MFLPSVGALPADTCIQFYLASMSISSEPTWISVRSEHGSVMCPWKNRYAEVDPEMKAKALAACAISGSDRPIDQSTAAGRKLTT